MKNGNILGFFPNKHLTQIQTKAHLTWMIFESSSKEFLQSPQYSWANCRMYLFTLAEVELIPPLLPDSSCSRGKQRAIPNGGSTQKYQLQSSTWGKGCLEQSRPACPQPGGLCRLHLALLTWGFSGAASFTLHRRFSSCGRCPISW